MPLTTLANIAGEMKQKVADAVGFGSLALPDSRLIQRFESEPDFRRILVCQVIA
jgi:hypothetical protein